ncbi:MAG: flavodoxin family protein [Phycisphaerales bacterium]
MARVEIVFYSAMGHTESIAQSVRVGLESVDGVEVGLLRVDELADDDAWARLDRADAIVLGSPTYMGGVSADFKRFMDQTGSRWYERTWMDKLCAGFTVGGGLSGDKQSALQAMHVFACQHGMIWISMGVGVREPGLDRLSSSIGMMAQAGNASVAETPPPEDHATAEAFGARVGRAAVRWATGVAG